MSDCSDLEKYFQYVGNDCVSSCLRTCQSLTGDER